MTEAPKPRESAMDVLKPYVVLACAAFVVGFIAYWMLGQALSAGSDLYLEPAYQAPASAPSPGDANPPRHI